MNFTRNYSPGEEEEENKRGNDEKERKNDEETKPKSDSSIFLWRTGDPHSPGKASKIRKSTGAIFNEFWFIEF